MSLWNSNLIQDPDKCPADMLTVIMSVFIAWGLMVALFMPGGWVPHDIFGKLVEPMTIWLLPLMMGYTGGRLTGGERGGGAGAMMTLGLIVGADIPVFPTAMIAGPLSGHIVRRTDSGTGVRSGWRLAVSVENFSIGIVGMLLAVLAFMSVGPLTDMLSQFFATAVHAMVNNHLLPLTSIFVEPAKILFLGRVISENIFLPLGRQQVMQTGSSIFFLLENPGPGLGVLMACMLYGNNHIRQFAAGAAIIHFLGGVPAMYFPYVLMNPLLILAVIFGGMAGGLTLVLLQGGMVAPALPGSLLAILASTPEDARFANLTAITVACIFSFMLSVILLNFRKKSDDRDRGENIFQKKNTREQLSDNQDEQLVAWMHTRQFNIAWNTEQELSVQQIPQGPAASEDISDRKSPAFQLSARDIFLNQEAKTKEQAILFAGEQLVKGGYVEQEYVNAMLIKESMVSSWSGNVVVLLWGTVDALDRVLNTGMVFCQYPRGVRFGEENEMAYLIIAIAIRDEHVQAMGDLINTLHKSSGIVRLMTTDSVEEVLDILVEFT